MSIGSTDPSFQHILCLSDLFRLSNRRYSNGYFDLVREPIRQGTGLDIGHAPETRHPHRLATGFDADRFRALAGVQLGSAEHQTQLAENYYQLNPTAEEYLFKHIPDSVLLLTMEIPPWLARGCIQRGIDFLDFAISPLRFGRDLYAALRTSSSALFKRLHPHAVLPEEIRLEASTLAANVRIHQSLLQDERQFHFQDMNGGLLFLGQAPSDASLLAPDGRTLRCADFADRLQALSQGKRMFYKGHPYAPEFSEKEIEALKHITGKPVEVCLQNAYQVLSTDDDLELTGISSGLLQEAAWFGKTAHTLFQPFVPLAAGSDADPQVYQQIHFRQLLAPAFWHAVLTPDRQAPHIPALPVLSHHHMRETLGLWWDYSKIMTWERNLQVESFERSGGIVLRQRIEVLEHAMVNPREGKIHGRPPSARTIHAVVVSTNYRNTDNWAPLFQRIAAGGGRCEAIYLSWSGDASAVDMQQLPLPVRHCEEIHALDPSGISTGRLKTLLDRHVGAEVDVIFLCDMQSYPSTAVHEALRARPHKPVVVGLQHGLFQSWWMYNGHFAADHLLCFGERHRMELLPAWRTRATAVGLPKLDALSTQATRDGGYVLYLAQRVPESTPVSQLLQDIERQTGLPVLVRDHPQYPGQSAHASQFPEPRIAGRAASQASLIEQIAHASWVLTPHSTGGLEALQLRKPLVLIPNHGLTAWAGYPAVAVDMSAAAVLDALHRAKTRHPEVQMFLDSALGGLRFDHTERAMQALESLLHR